MKAVVFDVGGVLIDWNPDYLYRKLIPDAFARAEFLRTVCPREWNFTLDAGGNWADAVAARIALYPDYADLICAYDERWLEMVPRLIPGTAEFKAQLRDRKIPVYAITNFSAEKWRVAQGAFPTLREFDGVVVSADERVMKPDPRIYEILLERFSLSASECLFIDDIAANVQGAKAVGMRGHLFTNAVELRTTVEAFLKD